MTFDTIGIVAECCGPKTTSASEPRATEGIDVAKRKPKHKYTTPYSEVLPPLRDDEFNALKSRIKTEGGVHDVVLVTSDDAVLDGHNRLEIEPGARTKVLKDADNWTEAERQAFVFRAGTARRNLSDEEIKFHGKPIAKELKKQKLTQNQIAERLGVSRQTIGAWLGGGNDAEVGTASPPSLTIKIPAKMKGTIFDSVEDGESQASVARKLKVSRRRIGQIVNAERKRLEKEANREAAVASVDSEALGVHLGDFREIGDDLVADDSLDLIFTDPPYDKESVPLYGDLAEFASRKLRPGGWCLAYSGQQFLPDVLDGMREHLTYAWCFAVGHSGGDLRFRKYKITNHWKPVVGFYREPLDAWWKDWFSDWTSGGKEKADHAWQQAVSEAEHFVSVLCPAGGIICDPCCGSGTTLLAAKEYDLRWIGFDQDAEAVKTALERLAE